ncbi:uncharacterized protein SPSK_09735 [Sporothrix schenckii 1099-18]|uniref:Uncharacterized protein n=1 Tax=Sporothrix schenckii 1099-18 TaxID=1397361 RepID=A0A0F2M518_SPOSC|nr:uncharacterized protein SPSK_09735 [Sporothrix schenckii 1099-18]KJR84189.1 hypothetical protein SPSK_09735 [Sporothrix schenckii 1099-18]
MCLEILAGLDLALKTASQTAQTVVACTSLAAELVRNSFREAVAAGLFGNPTTSTKSIFRQVTAQSPGSATPSIDRMASATLALDAAIAAAENGYSNRQFWIEGTSFANTKSLLERMGRYLKETRDIVGKLHKTLCASTTDQWWQGSVEGNLSAATAVDRLATATEIVAGCVAIASRTMTDAETASKYAMRGIRDQLIVLDLRVPGGLPALKDTAPMAYTTAISLPLKKSQEAKNHTAAMLHLAANEALRLDTTSAHSSSNL